MTLVPIRGMWNLIHHQTQEISMTKRPLNVYLITPFSRWRTTEYQVAQGENLYR